MIAIIWWVGKKNEKRSQNGQFGNYKPKSFLSWQLRFMPSFCATLKSFFFCLIASCRPRLFCLESLWALGTIRFLRLFSAVQGMIQLSDGSVFILRVWETKREVLNHISLSMLFNSLNIKKRDGNWNHGCHFSSCFLAFTRN